MLTKYEKMLDCVCESEVKYISTDCDIVPSHSITIDGYYGIYFNEAYFKTKEKRYVALAHEKAHCDTGTLYSINAPKIVKLYCEAKAWRRTIGDIVPLDELIEVMPSCVYCGELDIYELADKFEVTPEFMQRAIAHYQNANYL